MVQQLTIFDEFIEENPLADGMEYTVRSIYRSSGRRRFIEKELIKGDKTEAFNQFKESFKTYGFGHGKYAFNGAGQKGVIRIDGTPYEVTGRELFDVLLKLWETDELK